MSNNWYYTVIFYPQNGVAEAVRGAFRCAELRGFSAVNPDIGRLTGMQIDGLESFSFDTSQEAIDFLAAQGGLLEFWKDETDIAITFRPVTHAEENGEKKDSANPGSKRQAMRDTRLQYQISVIVGGYLLRFDRDQNQSVRVAKDAHSIFLDLCETVEASYGYCTDEYLLEFFFYNLDIPIEVIDSQIIESVRTKRPPAFLFWLQYFSNEYGKEARLAELVDMGGKVDKVPKGFSVSFFDWPWEQQRSSKLGSINKAWSELHHNGGTAK